MSQDQSVAAQLAASDPALLITDEELVRSRQRSVSFLNSTVTHISVGGSMEPCMPIVLSSSTNGERSMPSTTGRFR